MSRGYRYALIAVVGWLVFSPLTYAQQQTSPALESQPVTPSQQGNEAAGKQDNAPEKQPEAELLTPALNQIESAIRDGVLPKDEAKDQRQEDRDKADLQAQEDMALWAKRMFLATVASVIVTLAGLALIARTLHHTRRAADYAKDMVVEAKAATDATLKIIDQEKTSSQRQLRAYIGVESIHLDCPSVTIPNYTPTPIAAGVARKDFVILTIKNFGATPANKVYTWVNWINVKYPQGLPLAFAYPDHVPILPPGVENNMIETSLFPTQMFVSKIAMEDVTPVILSNAKAVFLYFYGRITYTDIDQVERNSYFCFRHLAGLPAGQEMERYRDHNNVT